MNSQPIARVALENLTADGKATAPGEGRRRASKMGPDAVRALLENFQAMTPMETEDADARIHLATGSQKVVVRYAGGRLILDDNVAFSKATVDDIMVRVFGSHLRAQTLPVDPALPATHPLTRSNPRKFLILLLVVGAFALVNWWSWPDPDALAIDWVPPGTEHQAMLSQVSGEFTGANEKLHIDVSSRRLTLSDLQGNVILSSPFRIGRSHERRMIVTEEDVIFDIIESGVVRIGGRVFRRAASSSKEK